MNNTPLQILILQELGVTPALLQQKVNEKELTHQLIFTVNDEFLDKNKVEIIITIKEKVTQELLNQFPNVKMIAVAFTGYDAVDISYCKLKNITVCNVPSYATDSVAELTIGLAISLLRDITKTNTLVANGGWNYKPGFELKGKKVGIIGTGTIGVRVAELFNVFGCEIIGWSRSKNEDFIKLGATYVNNLNDLCATVDILSLHTPLNENTKDLINSDQFNLMKPTAYLINVARGPVVNEKALIDALETHTIAGAAIDVFDVEPIPENADIIKVENALLTPHIAYKTQEALERRMQITLNNISSFLKGNPVNKV
jgi:D-3-phosphoglycerate dehydrogenase